jgi:hypothetical protein
MAKYGAFIGAVLGSMTLGLSGHALAGGASRSAEVAGALGALFGLPLGAVAGASLGVVAKLFCTAERAEVPDPPWWREKADAYLQAKAEAPTVARRRMARERRAEAAAAAQRAASGDAELETVEGLQGLLDRVGKMSRTRVDQLLRRLRLLSMADAQEEGIARRKAIAFNELTNRVASLEIAAAGKRADEARRELSVRHRTRFRERMKTLSEKQNDAEARAADKRLPRRARKKAAAEARQAERTARALVKKVRIMLPPSVLEHEGRVLCELDFAGDGIVVGRYSGDPEEFLDRARRTVLQEDLEALRRMVLRVQRAWRGHCGRRRFREVAAMLRSERGLECDRTKPVPWKELRRGMLVCVADARELQALPARRWKQMFGSRARQTRSAYTRWGGALAEVDEIDSHDRTVRLRDFFELNANLPEIAGGAWWPGEALYRYTGSMEAIELKLANRGRGASARVMAKRALAGTNFAKSATSGPRAALNRSVDDSTDGGKAAGGLVEGPGVSPKKVAAASGKTISASEKKK